MKELIEALQIFLKYGNPSHPTNCSHDELAICGYDGELFSKEDIQRLEELGFDWNGEYFYSYKYGSC